MSVRLSTHPVTAPPTLPRSVKILVEHLRGNNRVIVLGNPRLLPSTQKKTNGTTMISKVTPVMVDRIELTSLARLPRKVATSSRTPLSNRDNRAGTLSCVIYLRLTIRRQTPPREWTILGKPASNLLTRPIRPGTSVKNEKTMTLTRSNTITRTFTGCPTPSSRLSSLTNGAKTQHRNFVIRIGAKTAETKVLTGQKTKLTPAEI